MLMSILSARRSVSSVLSGAALLVLATAVALPAQEPATAPVADTDGQVSSSFSLERTLAGPLNLRVPPSDLSESSSGESSSAVPMGTSAPELLALGAAPEAGAMQPPPYRRRRYGRPNYNDRWHNTDGSNKLAFVVGGGFTVPAASTGKRVELNYALKGGAGINFSRKLGVLLEFNYDRFGVQGRELDNQYVVYNNAFVDSGIDFSGLDATSYIWSLTANPTFTLAGGENNSLYAVVGGGWYHRVTNFTLPATGQYCDPFYGCYVFQQNQTFDHYANNTAGINGGLGISHKLGRFSNERVFAEARYVYVFDAKDSKSQSSLYPPANYSTSYFPVTVGLRF